jgi:PEP-CTERM motif
LRAYSIQSFGGHLKNNYSAAALAGLLFAVVSPAAVLTENFDNVPALTASGGWVMVNESSPVGTQSVWFQGNSGVFSSQAGAADSYAAVNFNSVAGANTISNWLISPLLTFINGDTISFYSRTVDAPEFPDRLNLRLSTNGASTATADFTTILLTINPSLTTSGYPNVWTLFTATISGLGAPTNGRIAFHYDVTNGGPSGANSDYIGIDTLTSTVTLDTGAAETPEPATWAMMSIGLGLAGIYGRRR